MLKIATLFLMFTIGCLAKKSAQHAEAQLEISNLPPSADAEAEVGSKSAGKTPFSSGQDTSIKVYKPVKAAPKKDISPAPEEGSKNAPPTNYTDIIPRLTEPEALDEIKMQLIKNFRSSFLRFHKLVNNQSDISARLSLAPEFLSVLSHFIKLRPNNLELINFIDNSVKIIFSDGCLIENKSVDAKLIPDGTICISRNVVLAFPESMIEAKLISLLYREIGRLAGLTAKDSVILQNGFFKYNDLVNTEFTLQRDWAEQVSQLISQIDESLFTIFSGSFHNVTKTSLCGKIMRDTFQTNWGLLLKPSLFISLEKTQKNLALQLELFKDLVTKFCSEDPSNNNIEEIYSSLNTIRNDALVLLEISVKRLNDTEEKALPRLYYYKLLNSYVTRLPKESWNAEATDETKLEDISCFLKSANEEEQQIDFLGTLGGIIPLPGLPTTHLTFLRSFALPQIKLVLHFYRYFNEVVLVLDGSKLNNIQGITAQMLLTDNGYLVHRLNEQVPLFTYALTTMQKGFNTEMLISGQSDLGQVTFRCSI